MVKAIKISCKYCGNRWVFEVHEGFMGTLPGCEVCGESKNLKLEEADIGGRDAYGYRFTDKEPEVKAKEASKPEEPEEEEEILDSEATPPARSSKMGSTEPEDWLWGFNFED